jgi:hypothetical protein
MTSTPPLDRMSRDELLERARKAMRWQDVIWALAQILYV